MATSTTSAAPSASPTHTNNNTGISDGQSRPLLFFVALGFGVVFTNLWIIVGVKYCFRYNQRARQLAALDADGGDGMDLNNMQRPRRRREKKLMSMDEVNTRFPLTKYKIWRASREDQGLSAAGGVTAPPSRAASIKEALGLERNSTDIHRSAEVIRDAAASSAPQQSSSTYTQDFAASNGRKSLNTPRMHDLEKGSMTAEGATGVHTIEAAEDDDDDPIQTAVPAGLLEEPGDACAICLDSLDDDDEVRGLTCGHAFHAGCLDPWLTGRRACCPLCKADYYIPKPRPEGDPTLHSADRGPNPLLLPTNVWLGGRGIYRQPRLLVAGSRFAVNQDRMGFPQFVERRNHRHAGMAEDSAPPPGRVSRMRTSFSNFYRLQPSDGANVPAPPPQPEATLNPAQLEAAAR